MTSAHLSGYYFLSFAFIGTFAPFFSLYLHGIGSSAREIVILMAVMQSMRLFGPYLWGSWTDKGLPLKRAIALTTLGSLCGLSAFTIASSFSGMFIAIAALSLFWSGTLPLLETLTFAYIEDRVVHYGPIRMWGSLGFLGAVLAVGKLLDLYSFTIVPWVCGLILLSLLPISLVLPDALPRNKSRMSGHLPNFKATLFQPTVISLLGASFLMATAHGAFNVFYSIHLSEHGYGGLEISALWALGVAAEMLVFTQMPYLNRLFSPRTLLITCFAAAILRFAVIGWCVASISFLAFAQILHALSFGAHHAVSVSAINRCFTGGNQTKAQAIYASSHGGGTLLGSLTSGVLWSAFGSGWTFTSSSLLAFGGMIMIIIFIRQE